jgi:hypothetical protein
MEFLVGKLFSGGVTSSSWTTRRLQYLRMSQQLPYLPFVSEHLILITFMFGGKLRRKIIII